MALLLLGGLAACGSGTNLPPATLENRVDTVVVYAISIAAIGEPSAYDVVQRRSAITELGQTFDFVVDAEGQTLTLYPAPAFGLPNTAGVQIMPADSSFESIEVAPPLGYVSDSGVVAQPGDVFVVRSRASSISCLLGSISRYGKFKVLDVDTTTGVVRFEVLINTNCGYLSLLPGLPED